MALEKFEESVLVLQKDITEQNKLKIKADE
jgi:hypothetical protein